jgi:large conductance mechanosensitive channel
MNLRELWKEFRSFALKGNVIELAVAVVIGGAFGNIVNSLVRDILMPLLSYVIPSKGGYREWHLGRLAVGDFLVSVVNFAAIALAMFFLIVKLLGAVQRVAFDGTPSEPATKECPFCISVIPFKATRCAHCTADLTQST